MKKIGQCDTMQSMYVSFGLEPITSIDGLYLGIHNKF